jgi:hypothetical protein
VTLKNGVFWDVTSRGSCKNRRFGGTWRLMKEALGYSEMSVLTRATRRNIPEDTILRAKETLVFIKFWELSSGCTNGRLSCNAQFHRVSQSVSSVGNALTAGRSPERGVLPTVHEIKKQ